MGKIKKLFQFLFGPWLAASKYYKTRSENRSVSGFSQTGLDDSYLFDFKNLLSSYNNNNGFVAFSPTDAQNPSFDSGDNPQSLPPVLMGGVTPPSAIQKIVVKPKDVLNELETVPTPFSLALLDEKIDILKDKQKLITQEYSKREVTALIERVENRKKYHQHRSFFDRYQNTTDEKIDALLSKYDLVMKTSDIFVPEFPDDAIKIMKQYTEKTAAVCAKKPVFYVIAEAKDFRKAFEKRDPILLVQSPFGFYWQILGAWDKEMLLLSEL
jgi:hypothetical protein